MPAPAPACPAPTPASPAGASATYEAEHRRARERGVNPILYWLVRAVFQPFFHLYFRLSRIGREHIPTDGPVIFASNHRSFLDPFVIATLIRRPMYYVAKRELFRHRLQGWFLNSLGGLPGRSGQLRRRDDRHRQGDSRPRRLRPHLSRGNPHSPGRPRDAKAWRGPAGAGVRRPGGPLAVIGTEDVRRGWRIRPHKVRIRVGRALTFPRVQRASPALAQAVTDRVWPCVMLQWEWLGGVVPMRRAAVIGSGARAAALTELLARAGLDLDARSGAATATGPPLADCDLVWRAGLPAEHSSATLAALAEGCLEPEQWTRQLLRQTAGQRAA